MNYKVAGLTARAEKLNEHINLTDTVSAPKVGIVNRLLFLLEMPQIKILLTGEVREVTPNIAHGLIDSGKAVLVTSGNYPTRQMRTDTRAVEPVASPSEEPEAPAFVPEPKKQKGKKFRQRGKYRIK